MMDCDTTGIEPDLALVKFKKLVGGGSMQIVNQTVPAALRTLGYQEEQVEAIVEYIAEHGHVVDAPGLRPEHYAVFDCAMGERSIAPMGHVRMMAAVQPFLVRRDQQDGQHAGVGDGRGDRGDLLPGLEARASRRSRSTATTARSASRSPTPKAGRRPQPRRPRRRRSSSTGRPASGCRRSARRRRCRSRSRGAEGYLTASSYPDDGLGEVFLKMSKQGSTLAGVMDAFSIAISIGLQYGVPLETYVAKFTNMRFEPAGMTDDPDIRMATSVMDYIFRRLALDFLPLRDAGPSSASSPPRSAPPRSRAEAAGEEFDLAALAAERADRGQARPQTAPAEAKPAEPAAPSRGRRARRWSCWSGCSSKESDAPLCFTCGTKMRPAGSCYVCEGCGSTSGCS